MTSWIWRRGVGAGSLSHVRSMAGMALAMLTLLAPVSPSGAQDLPPLETAPVPPRHQPLAPAYLAHPYTAGPSVRSAEIRLERLTPGESIIAKFQQRAGLRQPWEGLALELHKKNAMPGATSRLGATAGGLGFGIGKPLDLKLYAFLPPDRLIPGSLRLITYESDAWRRHQDTFTLFTDTTFVLTAVSQRDNGGFGAGYPAAVQQIACVNARSAPPDGRTVGCVAGTGEVIEDPLTGEPALRMYLSSGPPQWLKSVLTDICVESNGTAPKVAVPFGDNYLTVPLRERGKQLCTGYPLQLDYVAVHQSGIDIDGVKLQRLASRGSAASGWKLRAEAPSLSAGGSWIQKLVITSAAPSPVADVPSKSDTRTLEADAPPATFSVTLSEWRWKLPLTRLWYGPLPDGADDKQPLKCAGGKLSVGSLQWTRDGLTAASAVSVTTTYFPPGLRLDVTQPSAKRRPLSKGLIVLGESANGTGYCGIATLKNGGPELVGKLQEEEPPPPPPQTTSELVFRRDGPGALVIEKVSQGRPPTRIAELNAASVSKTIQWSAGDKIRIRPAEPDVYSMSALKVDGAAVKIEGTEADRSVEVALTEQTQAIAIKMGYRPVEGFLTVVTPQGGIELAMGGGKTNFPQDAQPKRIFKGGVRLGEEVSVEPKDDSFSVSKLTLQSGGKSRTVVGATFKFERDDFPGGKLDLRVDVELKKSALALPAELVLKPVVVLGRRQLAFFSCKLTLVGLPAEFLHASDGRTRVKVNSDKAGRGGASYPVEVSGSATVCKGFEGDAQSTEKLAALDKGNELAIPVRRTGGRAFVGILSWPLAPGEDQGNLRAALKSLVDAYDAGATEGRYLWGAIYGPDGQRLVASETADYTPMDVFTAEKLDRFKAGKPALGYTEAVKRVLSEVADLEGTVDLLVVASVTDGACTWSSPFTAAAARGGRSALVRVAKAAPGLPNDQASRARFCDVPPGDKGAVGMAAEVSVDNSDRLLREALEAAAKSLVAPAPSLPPPPPEKKGR